MAGLTDGFHLFGEDFGKDLSRRLQNPLVQMGMQMMANSGPSLTPKGLFEGAPEAVSRGLQMQQEQAKLDQEEEAKNATLELLRTEDPELAAMIEAGNIGAEEAISLLMDKRQTEQGYAREDSRYDRARADDIEDRDYKASQPDWQTIEDNGDVYRVDMNDPASVPQLMHDSKTAPKMPDLETFYDDESGLEYKGYLDPVTRQPVRVGGLKAPTNGLSITTNPDGTTTVNQGGSGKYDQTADTGYGKMQTEIQNGALGAINTFDTLAAMEQTMSDPTFYSGFGSDQLLTLKRGAAALGIDPEGVSSMEQFNALSKRAVLDAMGGALGAGVSNGDRDYVDAQVASLGNTPEGNRQLIDIQRKQARRKIEIANQAQQYEAEHGQLDAGFTNQLYQWAEENPMFAPRESDAPAGAALTDMSDDDLYNQLGL